MKTCLILPLVAFLSHLAVAAPSSTTLTATSSGFFGSDGLTVSSVNPNLENYAVGWDPKDFSDAVLLRNFFVFDLSTVSGTITSATLDLYMPGPPAAKGYESDQPNEPYQITNTSTGIAQLTSIYQQGSATGQTIFGTLGTGTVFASTTVSASDQGTTIHISLNTAGVAFLNMNEGGPIALSGQDPTAPASGPAVTSCGSSGTFGPCRFFFTDTDPTGSGVFTRTPQPTLTVNFAPVPAITSVVSAAGFGGFSAVAPGSWVEIYGSNLAPDTRQWAGSDFSGNNAPTSLSGVEVNIGGQKAFIDYISSSPGQVNAQLPSNIPAGGPLPLTLTNANGTSAAFNVTVKTTEPGLLAPASFTISGNQYAVALLPDGATYILPTGVISGIAARPAHPGETITLYGIGFGAVTPSIPAGQIVTATNQLSASFQIFFGQTAADVSYSGLAPTFVGLYQFDVVVPAIPDSDLVPLTFNLAGSPGTQSLYTAVHQ